MVNQRISLKDVTISINGKVIGAAEEASVKVSRANEEAWEGGSYLPAEIVDGKVSISGSLSRAFVDVDLLNTLFPNTPLAPSFTLLATITSGKTPGRNIKLLGVKFDSIDVNSLGLDGYAKNAMEFKATNWSFES